MVKFQEFNFIILRMRMNLSCNNTNMQNFAFLGGNMHKTPKYKVILCGEMISETFRPPFPIYRG